LKILFITPRLPFPPNRGDRLRYFNFARVISKKHSVSLLSFIQSEEEIKYAEDFKGIFENIETVLLKPCKSHLNMILRLFSKLPLQVSYFYSKKMWGKVEETLKRERFDVIYAFHLRMAPYVSEIDGIYKVLDFTDAVSLFLRRMIKHRNLFLRPILYREYLSTRWYQSYIAKRFDECWLISTIDRDAMDMSGSIFNIALVPNGIDVDYFKPGLSENRDKNILFVGYMGIESIDAVLYFYEEIFPLVRREIPKAKFYIVGADPPKKIIKLTRDKNVVVTGFVDDLRTYYGMASVLIAPMRFVVGMQNKILEAMAMEVPVVTSSLGNEGIDAQHEKELFIADDPENFAKYIINLLKNKELRIEIGKNARKYVSNKFNWNAVVDRMNLIEENIQKCR
jgi:sugar transferase (PEP-CTERM/EpsH1 system associated)